MYLMELIIKVLKIKSRDIIIILLNTLIILTFYYLFFEDSEILYPLILSISLIFIYLVIEIIIYREFIEKLENCKRTPDYKHSGSNYYNDKVLDVISELHNKYLNQIYKLNQAKNERETLVSRWIHNMKTSITVIGLACEKESLEIENNKYILDIKEENEVLKKNLEECLNVLRLDDFSRDYITEKCNISEIIKNIVNYKKRDFIYKGVFPKVCVDESIYVYTDRKWCRYMLEQIIANAIKYSKCEKGNKINIFIEEKEDEFELVIKDEGIGIKKEDLPRVFDPFFTGSNGRNERSATGIGLYMVKLIAKKLGHAIEIESEIDVGTEVKIIFKNESII